MAQQNLIVTSAKKKAFSHLPKKSKTTNALLETFQKTKNYKNMIKTRQ